MSNTEDDQQPEHSEQKQNIPKGIVPEHLLQVDVVCVLADGEMNVPAGLMQQSKLFSNWFTDNCITSAEQLANPDYKFSIPKVPTETMEKTVEWMRFHIGAPEPVIEEDPLTCERKWFDLTAEEKQFLEIRADKLGELLEAGNYLDLRSMYLYGCQEMFRWMMKMVDEGRGEELRQIMEMEPLTEEEIEAVNKKNIWCTY